MSEENGSSRFAFFIAGMGIGAILALLFAPRSGKETRDFVARKAEEGRDYLASKSRDLREQADELVEKGRSVLEKQGERVTASFDAAKQAWKEEKGRAR